MDNESAITEAAAFRRLRATHDTTQRQQLREQLIEQWLWLPRYLVSTRRYHAPGWEHEDFVSEGTVGLIQAIDSYEPDGKHAGLRFHTVAEWLIRRQINSAIQDDIAEQPTVPLRAFEPVLTPTWLQDRITRELEALPATGPSVEEQVMAAVDGVQVSATLEAALLLLPERQREIITRRFGLSGDQRIWTMAEVGRYLGIHKSNVCRTQQKALCALRAHLSTTSDGALILTELEQRSKRVKTRAA